MAKSAKHKKKNTSRFDSAGWGFWLVCFILLYGPGSYIGYQYSVDSQKAGILPWLLGFMIAAFGAGVISVAVNYALRKRVQIARRRQAKKAN